MPDDLRWVKWWFADWKGDAALRMCGLAARGLWKEMLCLMHEAAPYGHLLVSGKQPTPKQIGALVGATEKEVKALLAELEDAGVFSRTDDGTIYSRRMIKDEARRVKARIDGKRGGNPALVNHEYTGPDNPDDDGGLTGGVNPQEAEAEIRGRERKNPNPSAQAEGDDDHIHDLEERGGRPAGWKGRWKGLRANGTNPRAVGTNPRAQAAAAEAAKPPPPEPTGPVYALIRRDRHDAAEFYRAWLGRCAIDEPGKRIVAPSPFVAARIKAECSAILDPEGWRVEAAA